MLDWNWEKIQGKNYTYCYDNAKTNNRKFLVFFFGNFLPQLREWICWFSGEHKVNISTKVKIEYEKHDTNHVLLSILFTFSPTSDGNDGRLSNDNSVMLQFSCQCWLTFDCVNIMGFFFYVSWGMTSPYLFNSTKNHNFNELPDVQWFYSYNDYHSNRQWLLYSYQ